MQRSIAERAAVVAALVLVLAVNWLANALPLGGMQTGEVSALYESYFTPAGFTFAIWGVIYAGLVLYTIYQAFPARRDEARLLPVGRLFVINCILNAAWLFAWHYQFIGLSMLLMLCVLATLVGIYRHLGARGDTSGLVRIPFTLYLAWICVATLANASALQTAFDGNDILLSHVNWTLLKIALAGAVGAIVCVLRRDVVFVLVVAWAAYGIASKQAAVPEVHGAALTVSALAVLVAVFTLVRVVIRRGAAAA
jgi:hypothetical protein